MTTWAEKLQTLDEQAFESCWESFFLNEEATVQFLAETPKDGVVATVTRGQAWRGTGWNTTRCAVQVRSLTNIAMVSSNVVDYLNSFLYSLALAAGVEVHQLELGDKASDVAFKLYERWATHLQGFVPQAGEGVPEGEGEGEGEQGFTWQWYEETLPTDLAQILAQHNKGELRLDVKFLLDQVPVWNGIKQRAEENNHRQDNKSQVDKVLKTVQQKWLNVLRVHAALHSALSGAPPEVLALSQQLFAYCCLAEADLVKERKKRSIPTAIAQSNGLFSQEDMKLARETTAINRQGAAFSGMSVTSDGNQKWCFPTNTGPKSWKFKTWRSQAPAARPWRPFNAGKGKGKGKGKGFSGYESGHGQSPRLSSVAGEQKHQLHRSQAEVDARTGHGAQRSIGKPSGGYLTPLLRAGGQHSPGHSACPPVPVGARGRGQVLPSAFVSPIATVQPLVGTACPRASVGFNPKWCATRMGVSTQSVGLATPQKSRGNQRGGTDFVGVSSSWCSAKSSLGGNKTFGSLVHHQKARGKNYQSATHFRLSQIKSVFSTAKISVGPPAGNFPLPAEKSVGMQGGPERCLFSFATQSSFATVHPSRSRKQLLGVPGSLFRTKRSAPKIYVSDEGTRESLEGTRYPGICLSRRHFAFGSNKKAGGKPCAKSCGNTSSGRVQNQRKEIHLATCAKGSTSGVSLGFPKRGPGNWSRKVKNDSEGTGKDCIGKRHVLSKNGFHFRLHSKLLGCPPLFEGFHRRICEIRQPAEGLRLGSCHTSARKSQGSTSTSQGGASKLAGQALSAKSFKSSSQRFQHIWLGRPQYSHWGGRPRILAAKNRFAHQHKRVVGSDRNGKKFGQTGGNNLSLCGQHDSIFLSPKTRGQTVPLQCSASTFSATLSGKQNFGSDKMGALRKNESGQSQSVDVRFRGLHLAQGSLQCSPAEISKVYGTESGHVQFPSKLSVARICEPLASFSSKSDRCFNLPLGQFQGRLRQPPVVSGGAVAAPVEGRKTNSVPLCVPLLGFSQVVAPVNQIAHSQNAMLFDKALQRNVLQLSQSVHEKSKVAPSLFNVVRGFLEKQQVPPEVADDFIQRNQSLVRYDTAFRLLWAVLADRQIQPEAASVHDVAAGIVCLFSASPAQARNAYSAMLMLPGFGSLRFHSLLAPYRRRWNTSLQKYAVFWDPSPILQELAQVPLENSVGGLRDRLIILLRIVCLHRSVDLSRVLRTISVFEDRPFLLVRRKGWTMYRWEEIPQVPERPEICPWTVLRRYVAATALLVPKGSPLFISVVPPYKALSANTLGSLTKKILHKFGVAPEWGPHSTRGAGVQMFKNAGLSSEVVCQIGQWKDIKSFTSHYLRLNAAQGAGEAVKNVVHRSSLGGRAEPELSRTPGRFTDPGGRDNEGEARNTSEPTPPTQKRPLEREGGSSPRKRFQFAHLRTRLPPPAALISQLTANSGTSSQ